MLANKKSLGSERASPIPSQNRISSYTDEDLDRFQRELNREKIIDIWKKMREGGNSKDGIVTKEKFKQIFFEHFKEINIKPDLVNDIFERFKKKDLGRDEKPDKRRNEEKRNANLGESEKGEIDLHDLVISLAIISTMHYDDKLELIFDLTDIDEDGCLSPDDICKMILAIERNFAKEGSLIDPDNGSSLYNVATKKALRRFNYIFLYDGLEESNAANKKGKARKDKLLGHYKDFLEKLGNKQNLYRNLLPKNQNLRRVLNNKAKEITFNIHKNEEEQFKKFRAELHGTIWKGKQQEIVYRNPNPKKEEYVKFQNKEPGDVASYGIKTIEEEQKIVENVQEAQKMKEFIIQERSNLPEHKKRLKDMKEKSYPNLEEVMMATKYETKIKKKNVLLPPLNLARDNDGKNNNLQNPDLASLIEKRVERLKKEYKYLGDNYKDYLLNKLTSSATDRERTRNATIETRRIHAYKFLL